ncbi:hypothetical protein [Acinetobacter guerrae]|uniref:hypothetical protein n=1 Tax=Acinetobacter guerrae TaxID=1843371 RepID=UPI00128CFDF1|nr:hypothetical protein [Acinetobacter guerrae]MPW43129.1 hypothetical protein [Acinetobacter guerrae]
MTGQQRNILATMGVDVWIPRALSCQKKQPVSFWRDQTPIVTEATVLVLNQQVDAIPSEPDVAKSIEIEPSVKDSFVEVVQSNSDLSLSNSMPKQQPQVAVIQQAFILEAYCLDRVILIVETSQLSNQQRQLWMNIQSALSGLYHELKWPLPLENFRDGRGVQAYVQGFLDALAIDKQILILGKLDFISHIHSMQLASLQEMIDQPLLKRRLWQLMISP